MKQELIVKSNDILVHPLYKTSIELKIFSKIILELRKNPEETAFFLNKRELLLSIGCDKNSYTELKKVAERMFRPVDVNKGKGDFILRAVFLEINANIDGQIMFEISPKMKPYFLDLSKNFTQYYFENIARLRSSFSIRIYEFLKQYESFGSRKSSIIEIRNFLNIEDDKYKLYADFKRKVILVAQKELKEKTDLYFEFEEIKQGRKISEINFIIFKNNKIPLLDNNQPDFVIEEKQEPELLKTLVEGCKINKKVALNLIKTVDEEKIRRNIEYTVKEHQEGRVKNFTAYLVEAVKNDYANSIPLFEVEAKTKKNNKIKEAQLKERMDKIKTDASLDFSRTEKEKFINSLSDSEKEELLQQIINELSHDKMSVNMILKKGLSSPVAGLYLIQRIPDFDKRKAEFVTQRLKEAGFLSL